MIKKGLTAILSLLMLTVIFTGCTNNNEDANKNTQDVTATPIETGSSFEDLASEGTMEDDEDSTEVDLTAEEQAFFGSFNGDVYKNGWLGFTIDMPDNYSFYKVPQLFELYNDVLTNMDATRVKDKKTGIALGSDENGSLTINAVYIKSGATTADAKSYVEGIKNDIKESSSDFTDKDGADRKVKGITYKTFTCEYKVDDTFYEKHYWTVKDGYVVDICFSANSTDALDQLTTAFVNSK